ncbi:hypothetical protein ACE1AT_17665 [Pelatocladus sp. BLCC-F211]|uniref:hypothetical protein n=1 Tax=Pelatocladus sp. BLCC-F211 TaxID=3342752 RepID=UPI0035B94B64
MKPFTSVVLPTLLAVAATLAFGQSAKADIVIRYNGNNPYYQQYQEYYPDYREDDYRVYHPRYHRVYRSEDYPRYRYKYRLRNRSGNRVDYRVDFPNYHIRYRSDDYDD